MNSKIQEQIQLLQDKWFTITDQEKVLWYLEKVWYHRLSPYFKNASGDIERVIGLYIFDKRLRLLILDMLEVMENAIKSIMINYIGSLFDNKNRYLDIKLYEDKYIAERLGFIGNKTVERKANDATVKNYFSRNPQSEILPDYIFFDKLTFGELIKIYRDLKIEYKKIISEYFWINVRIFENRIFSLKYLRNLCSHYENVFNKTMITNIKSEMIEEMFGNVNRFIWYFALLSVFNKVLIPNFNRYSKIIELMTKFSITSEEIWLQTKNLPSELESEAREVLVDSLYTKYIKKSNLFEDWNI